VAVADSLAPYEANKERLSPITTVSASVPRSYCWSGSLPCLGKIYASRSPQLRQHKDPMKAEWTKTRGRFRACKAASHECPRSIGEGPTLNHGADELMESALGVLSQQPTPGAAATMRAIKSS
jgi:hypothetical protein